MSTPIRSRRNGKENLRGDNHTNTPIRRRGSEKPVRVETPQRSSKNVSGTPKVTKPVIELKQVRPVEPERQYENTTARPRIKDILRTYKPSALCSSQKEFSEGECQHIVLTLWKRIYQLEVELINNQEDVIQYQQEYQDIKDKGSQLYDIYISQQNTLTDLKTNNEKLQLEANEYQRIASDMEEQAQAHQEQWKERFDEQEELIDQYEQRIEKLEEENENLIHNSSKRNSGEFVDAVTILGDGSFSEEDEEEDEDLIHHTPADITEEFSMINDAFNFDDSTKGESTSPHSNTSPSDSNEYQKENTVLREEISRLQEELEEESQNFQNSVQQSAETIAELHEEISIKQKQIETLEEEIKLKAASNNESTITELKEANLRLSRQYGSLSEDYNKILGTLRTNKQKQTSSGSNKLDNLEKQNNSLQKLQQEQLRNLESLQIELKDEQLKNRELYSSLQSSLETMQFMKDERHVWNSVAVQNEQQIEELQERFASSEVQLSRALSKEKKLSTKILSLEQSFTESQNLVKELNNEIAKLSHTNTEHNEIILQLQEQLDASETHEKALTEQITLLETNLNDERKQYKLLEKKNDLLTKEFEACATRELAGKDEISSLSALIDAEAKAKVVLEEKIKAIRKEQETISEKCSRIKEKLLSSVARENTLSSELSELKVSSETEEKRLHTLCDQLQEEIESLEQKLSELVSKHTETLADLDTSRQQENEYKEKIELLSKELQQEKLALQELEEKARKELSDAHSMHSLMIDSLKDDHKKVLEGTCETLREEMTRNVTEQQKQLEAAHRILVDKLEASHVESLSNLSSKANATLESTKETHATEISEIRRTIENLKAVNTQQHDHIDQLNASLSAHAEELTTTNHTIESLQTQLSEVTKSYKNASTELQRVTKELESFQSISEQQRQENEEQIKSLQEKQTENQATYKKTMNDIVAKYEEELKELTVESVMSELDKEQMQLQLDVLLTLWEERNALNNSNSVHFTQQEATL